MKAAAKLTAGMAVLMLAATAVPIHLAQGADPPRYGTNTSDRQAVIEAITARVQADPRALDEFDEMILFTDLSGWQLRTFVAAVERRAAQWEAFAATDNCKQLQALRPELAAARQANDAAKIEALQKQVEPLQKDEAELRTRIRADVVATLSLDQQRDWAAYVLWGHWGGLRRRFRSVELTEDQLWRAQAVCRQEMASFVNPLTLRQDPYLWVFRHPSDEKGKVIRDKVAARLAKEVLTPDQQKKLAPSP
jgi:hypothetical protein